MLNIAGLRLPVGAGEKELRMAAAAAIKVNPEEILSLVLTRQSVDARKKEEIRLVCSVRVTVGREEEILRRNFRGVSPVREETYSPPAAPGGSRRSPVICGMGPAGLFAALVMARAGQRPVILERGRELETRMEDVARFWRTGRLSPSSNVQFGEGGAGTFSDGKLFSGIHDPRIRFVLDTFVLHGAPEDILWSQKPHIGTDCLRNVVKSIREELLSLGAEIRFEHQLCGLNRSGANLSSIQIRSGEGEYEFPCDTLILAPGHSARDTFLMLQESGIPMERKNFAVGVRIEHCQETISRRQYGTAWNRLPPADYKLSCHLPSGRSAFSFCVCPGGQVVAAASADGLLVTNGMSFRARDGKNCNGGFLVEVTPDDFGGEDPLAGLRFQERWEAAAYERGGKDFRAPAQKVGDFLNGTPSAGPGSVLPTYRPGVSWGSLDGVLPDYVLETLRQALPVFDRKLRGFADPDAVLTGVETRSSSPVRILRGDQFQSPGLSGLYPCGEGAGYAGGITSAAVDGVRTAEAALRNPA